MWPCLLVCSQAASYSVYLQYLTRSMTLSVAPFLQLALRMEQTALLLPRCEGEVLEEAVSVKAV